MSPVYDGVNCSAEDAEWFTKFDSSFGPMIERIMEGNEDEAIRINWKRWATVMRYVNQVLKRRILFNPANINGEYGEKHPMYKQFEFLSRGMMEVTPGRPPPAIDPMYVGPFLYILFARGDRVLDEARSYLQVEILHADGTELRADSDGTEDDERKKVEKELRDLGALGGVP